jgi:hypothetical protein
MIRSRMMMAGQSALIPGCANSGPGVATDTLADIVAGLGLTTNN